MSLDLWRERLRILGSSFMRDRVMRSVEHKETQNGFQTKIQGAGDDRDARDDCVMCVCVCVCVFVI